MGPLADRTQPRSRAPLEDRIPSRIANTALVFHIGGCQNYAPFLGTLNNRCRIIIGAQKGTIILTTTHMAMMKHDLVPCCTIV